MKVIEPTKQEVFKALKQNGCCWLGGKGCECYSRQLGMCFEMQKKRMMHTEYTPADPNNPVDWEEKIEQAATSYLEKIKRTEIWWIRSPTPDYSVSYGCTLPPPPKLEDVLKSLPTDLKDIIKKENFKNGNKD